MLIRRHLGDPADLAYFLCHVPAGRACSFTTLIRVAGRRWPVEEDFALGKTWLGLADSQVRCHTAITRHLALAMAAIAACAVTAALARERTSALARPPTSPDDLPPADPGLIPRTAAEVKRLFNLVTRTWQTIRHYLGWSWWRRRHQARARWFHQRARLRGQSAGP
jgi:hypothetical protein